MKDCIPSEMIGVKTHIDEKFVDLQVLADEIEDAAYSGIRVYGEHVSPAESCQWPKLPIFWPIITRKAAVIE
jgi:hypothetical protein